MLLPNFMLLNVSVSAPLGLKLRRGAGRAIPVSVVGPDRAYRAARSKPTHEILGFEGVNHGMIDRNCERHFYRVVATVHDGPISFHQTLVRGMR